MFQAAELGEFTAKIALLEEAKRKKEEEANEWQHKVMHLASPHFTHTYTSIDGVPTLSVYFPVTAHSEVFYSSYTSSIYQFHSLINNIAFSIRL